MGYEIAFSPSAKKELSKLDKPNARRIISFLSERVATLDNPCLIGEALKGSKLGDFWKYRVGNYRIICSVEDDVMKVLVLRVAHRRKVYEKGI